MPLRWYGRSSEPLGQAGCRKAARPVRVLRPPGRVSPTPARPIGPVEGYLVGAYCIERELLTWRRLCFPDGVEVGDVVVFPNTAGYLMHILESASHQIPLARNLIVGRPGGAFLDPIDRVED